MAGREGQKKPLEEVHSLLQRKRTENGRGEGGRKDRKRDNKIWKRENKRNTKGRERKWTRKGRTYSPNFTSPSLVSRILAP